MPPLTKKKKFPQEPRVDEELLPHQTGRARPHHTASRLFSPPPSFFFVSQRVSLTNSGFSFPPLKVRACLFEMRTLYSPDFFLCIYLLFFVTPPPPPPRPSTPIQKVCPHFVFLLGMPQFPKHLGLTQQSVFLLRTFRSSLLLRLKLSGVLGMSPPPRPPQIWSLQELFNSWGGCDCRYPVPASLLRLQRGFLCPLACPTPEP